MKKTAYLAIIIALWSCLPLLADGVDMTSKIVNPGFDDYLYGWQTEMYTTNLSAGNVIVIDHAINELDAGREGYWYFNGLNCYFMANGYFGHENRVYQTITGLENGTYVFSAVSGLVREGANPADSLDYQNCVGVYFFANEESEQIQGFTATQFANRPWCHTKMYRIPVIVTDGTLTIGQRFEEGNNAAHCTFENARLYYFGDIDTDKALMEMCKNDIDYDCYVADTVTAYPMSKNNYDDIKHACSLKDAATSYEELRAVDDSIRTALAYGRRSIHAFEPLVQLVSAAEEVLAGEWSEMVTTQLKELSVALDQVKADLAGHTISADAYAGYYQDFEETINRVRIDALWDLLDQLYTFIDFPEEASEENPIFGITSHPGFGDGDGQYPMSQYDRLEALYDEVNNVLADIEQGLKGSSAGFPYIAIIENAVKECIASANTTSRITLPYDYILDPDPNDPTQPFVLKTQAEINAWNSTPHLLECQQTTTFNGQEISSLRYQTPLLMLDREYDILTINIKHTHKDLIKATNDGPVFILYELYILDAEGNRIEISPEDISSNSIGDGIPSYLLDGGYTNSPKSYFQSSTAGVANRGYHYLRVKLPEPMSQFKLVFDNIWTASGVQNCPSEIIIEGMSLAEMELTSAIDRSISGSRTWGIEPCYYEGDFSAFDKAVSDAKAVLADPNRTNAQMTAAADALNEAIERNEALTMIQPVEGQEYFITSRQLFMEKQGKQKNLTVFQDSILWWDSANPSDPNQRWLFTQVEPDDETDTTPYYTIKNVGTGKYVGDFLREAFEPTGEPIAWGNPIYVKLGNKPAKFRLTSLNQGQTLIQCFSMNIAAWGTMACQESNGGAATETPGACGSSALTGGIGYSIVGVYAAVTNANAGQPNTTSAFSIVPALNDLPYTIEAADVSDKKLWHFSTGGKMLTFTADKNCAFANFKLYDKNHAEVSTEMSVFGNELSVIVPSNMGDFYFAFDNTEGVQTITINASDIEPSSYEILRDLYASELFDYTEGTEIGCIKNLSAYTAAMTKAEELLADEGVNGTPEEFAAAATAIEEAVAALETVQPEAGKTYIIVSSYPKNYVSHDMGFFYSEQANLPGWTYLDPENPAFHWMFEPSEKEGGWYIKNELSQSYIDFVPTLNISIGMNEAPASFEVIGRDTTSVLLHCIEDEEAINRNWNLHSKNISAEFIPYGPVVFIEDNPGARWFIREIGYYTNVDVIEAEPERPWATGIYDLYGRRVENPAKGIYIVNGKKMLIK